MRSRLNAKTPASMPDMKNESAKDSAITAAMTGPFSTSMASFAVDRFNQHLAHTPFVRRGGREFQSAKDHGLSDAGHDLKLRQQQSPHRVHVRHVAQFRIFTAKILQPHRRVHAPAAFAQL